MKIGIDLDDTITAMPEFFAIITKALIQKHQIYIITYRDGREATIIDLNDYNISYTELIMPNDNDETPQAFKSRVATELGIDLMIDDSPENLSEMPPGVKRMWMCDDDVFDLKKCIRALKEK
jgi:hypothetical protein